MELLAEEVRKHLPASADVTAEQLADALDLALVYDDDELDDDPDSPTCGEYVQRFSSLYPTP
jgi:hypothetical protein